MRAAASDGLMALGAISLLIAFILLVLLYRRESRANRSNPGHDLTNMMILLQTMREMLDQQKALAREFNKSVDGKVSLIRKVIRALASQHEQLQKTHRELTAMMEATKADLARIRSHAAAVRASRGRADEEPPARHDPPPDVEDAPHTVEPEVATEPELPAPLQALAQPAQSPSGHDIIANWTGLDFAGDKPDPYGLDEAERAPTEPADPETTREAFRKLLNLSTPLGHAPSVRGKTSEDPPAREGDNGRLRSDALRARVVEYGQAGMPVAEIAQELGVSKGEVRLILGLHRKEQQAGK